MVGIDAIVRITYAERETVHARYVEIDGLMCRATLQHSAGENLRSIGQNMKHDRAIGARFIIHANIGLKPGSDAAQTIFDTRKGMNPQALRVSLAVQLNRVAADAFVAGQRTPANVTINGLERR